MKEFFIFVGIFAAYIILQKWILPKLGIQTWMTGGCSVEQKKKDKAEPIAESIEEWRPSVRPRDLVQMELDVPAHRIQAPADSAPKPPRERLAMFWATLLPSETTRKLPGGRDGPLLPTLIGEWPGDDTATIGSSQMYASKATRREGISRVMADAPSAGGEEVGG